MNNLKTESDFISYNDSKGQNVTVWVNLIWKWFFFSCYIIKGNRIRFFHEELHDMKSIKIKEDSINLRTVEWRTFSFLLPTESFPRDLVVKDCEHTKILIDCKNEIQKKFEYYKKVDKCKKVKRFKEKFSFNWEKS